MDFLRRNSYLCRGVGPVLLRPVPGRRSPCGTGVRPGRDGRSLPARSGPRSVSMESYGIDRCLYQEYGVRPMRHGRARPVAGDGHGAFGRATGGGGARPAFVGGRACLPRRGVAQARFRTHRRPAGTVGRTDPYAHHRTGAPGERRFAGKSFRLPLRPVAARLRRWRVPRSRSISSRRRSNG